MKVRSIALTCLCWGLLVSQTVRADGVIRNGLGARVAGRGGTNIAFADSGTVLHDNPAGMINIAAHQLQEVGADILLTDIVYRDANRVASSDHDPIPLGNLAMIGKSADEQWAYGLGMFSPGGFATDYEMSGPAPFTGTQKYKSFGSLARILGGVAWQADDRLSLGASLGVAVSHMEMEGPYALQGPSLTPGTPTLLDLQATGAALSWSVGLQYELTEATTWGVAFQGDTNFNLDGHASTTVPGLGSSRFDALWNMRWPMSLGTGLRHQLCPHRTLGLDVIWYNWSAAFDDFGLDLTNPDSVAYRQVVGTEIAEHMPLRWRDSISVRVGMERQLTALNTLRYGYVYHRNPIPTSTLTPFLNTTLEHTVSLGLGHQLPAGWTADVAYQYMFGPTNRIGDSGLAGDEFSQSEMSVRAHFIYLGLIRTF